MEGSEGVVERIQLWSMLSSEVGTGSQEEYVERAGVGCETISPALSESKDAPGRTSSLPRGGDSQRQGQAEEAGAWSCSMQWCTCGPVPWDLCGKVGALLELSCMEASE